MMKKMIVSVMTVLMATTMQAQGIGHIETTQSWHFVYDQKGKKIRTIGRSQGELVGFSSKFYILMKGHSWYYTYDMNGRKIHTFAVSSVGEVLSVSGDTFTSRKGSWIYTWTKEGRKINTRLAK